MIDRPFITSILYIYIFLTGEIDRCNFVIYIYIFFLTLWWSRETLRWHGGSQAAVRFIYQLSLRGGMKIIGGTGSFIIDVTSRCIFHVNFSRR